MNQLNDQSHNPFFSILGSAISQCPNYDSKMNYLLESRKIFLFNQVLQQQIEFIKDQNSQLDKQCIQPQKKQRRKATQISKLYKCTQCEKSYGSEASLNLHSKLKHPTIESESKTQIEQSFQI
ncbi:unnamed protein product (macronuclear) [Paramecium tetraurelia]|uniref:C2H2-type domain-containing protein n=1 Tax=Paramecium tetraurelia TaxID=5888 RepID=A0CXZ9_PARTE|nr:uncharacterized protein GSPATT00011298001 [Paramecium tetraurelia]CAK75666.1 unnamed protein product [Paramecium tetraurelia]|eukprot:XP_001443063.1 hypothetical protein (macronuclear) [Paramecium tetraurelia strain d4-2]